MISWNPWTNCRNNTAHYLPPHLESFRVHRIYKPRSKDVQVKAYEGVSKSFRAESITEYTLTAINTRWESTQRVIAAKLTRLTHKIPVQLHLVTESWTIYSSRSRRPVRRILDTPSYIPINKFIQKL